MVCLTVLCCVVRHRVRGIVLVALSLAINIQYDDLVGVGAVSMLNLLHTTQQAGHTGTPAHTNQSISLPHTPHTRLLINSGEKIHLYKNIRNIIIEEERILLIHHHPKEYQRNID